MKDLLLLYNTLDYLTSIFAEQISFFSSVGYAFEVYAAYGPHHPRGKTVKAIEKLTEDNSLLHDKEHLQEDLKNTLPDNATLNMTPEELEFYYFTLHDSDKNTKLDGLEMLRAIQHVQHEHDGHGHMKEHLLNPEKILEFTELIDKVLEEDDLDRDGYLSYSEYVKGRNRVDNIELKKS